MQEVARHMLAYLIYSVSWSKLLRLWQRSSHLWKCSRWLGAGGKYFFLLIYKLAVNEDTTNKHYMVFIKYFYSTLVCLAQTGGSSINYLCSLLDVWYQKCQPLWFLIRSIWFYSCFSFVLFRSVWGKKTQQYSRREYFLTSYTVAHVKDERTKMKTSLLKWSISVYLQFNQQM